MAAPMDLHVKYEETRKNSSLKDVLLTLEKLGYETVALSYFKGSLQGEKKKKNTQADIFQADSMKMDEKELKAMEWKKKPPRLLTRFSATLSDASQTHKLKSEEALKFDLIAVQPTCEKTFLQACQTLEIDIIMIHIDEALPFYIKRKPVNVAIERGIHFEIQYSGAIKDQSIRKNMIINGRNLVRFCKGKNVIFSSGCTEPFDLRGPYDAANLGLLFGMTEAQCKMAVTTNPRAVLLHAEARKIYKSTIHMEKIERDGTNSGANNEKKDSIGIKQQTKRKGNNDLETMTPKGDNTESCGKCDNNSNTNKTAELMSAKRVKYESLEEQHNEIKF